MLILPMVLAALIDSPAQDSTPGKSRDFEVTYRATVRDIPDDAKALDVWLPIPQTDRYQTIHRLTIDAPGPPTIGREGRFGDHCLHVRISSPRGPVTVAWNARATRRENPGTLEPLGDAERALDLAPEPLVPLSGPVRDLADQATAGLPSDAARARAIYDKVTAMMRYDKSGTGWGRGDALFACDAKRGNCSDFHALVIGMARSSGIPARFAIGLPLPEARGSGETEINGYHCWAELYVGGRGWVPVDASEAVKHPSRREYFFGHHDENRLELSRGRNLTLSPAQRGPALNFFVDPYAEVDGRPHAAVDRKVSFQDLETTTRAGAAFRRPVHTYSIVARDPKTGELGVAVQSHWFAIGPIVPFAESGVGAIATQSFVDSSYGKLGLDLMRAGRSAPDALKGLLAADENREVRQVAMIDAQGRVSAHTGSKCIPAAGHHVGTDYSVQANLMLSDQVWPAMSKAFEESTGDLAERMLKALEAAQAAGGDIRGKQAAALIVVSGKPTGKPWSDRVHDVRVDDHPEPVVELRRLVKLQRAYNLMNEGDLAVEHKDHEGALRAYGAAEALVPDSAEMIYWHAVALVNMKRVDEALPLFKKVFAMDPNWKVLTPRLPGVGLLPDDKAALTRILESDG
jgi:uncharacterized Ntn-hydrolase superfamily protein/transglutaminase-like putative cysteine protease